jgi:hypothetical protein
MLGWRLRHSAWQKGFLRVAEKLMFFCMARQVCSVWLEVCEAVWFLVAASHAGCGALAPPKKCGGEKGHQKCVVYLYKKWTMKLCGCLILFGNQTTANLYVAAKCKAWQSLAWNYPPPPQCMRMVIMKWHIINTCLITCLINDTVIIWTTRLIDLY